MLSLFINIFVTLIEYPQHLCYVLGLPEAVQSVLIVASVFSKKQLLVRSNVLFARVQSYNAC